MLNSSELIGVHEIMTLHWHLMVIFGVQQLLENGLQIFAWLHPPKVDQTL